ncbi:MAG: hypothetical protein FJZ11_04035 [Candidatus Omnitrophica bacterium]|nr:hypothetical protein [Candidatus Omnitrophota bacterium]
MNNKLISIKKEDYEIIKDISKKYTIPYWLLIKIALKKINTKDLEVFNGGNYKLEGKGERNCK